MSATFNCLTEKKPPELRRRRPPDLHVGPVARGVDGRAAAAAVGAAVELLAGAGDHRAEAALSGLQGVNPSMRHTPANDGM